jgi:hypothetical protein
VDPAPRKLDLWNEKRTEKQGFFAMPLGNCAIKAKSSTKNVSLTNGAQRALRGRAQLDDGLSFELSMVMLVRNGVLESTTNRQPGKAALHSKCQVLLHPADD